MVHVTDAGSCAGLDTLLRPANHADVSNTLRLNVDDKISTHHRRLAAALPYVAPVLLVALAVQQIILSSAFHLSPWTGGGSACSHRSTRLRRGYCEACSSSTDVRFRAGWDRRTRWSRRSCKLAYYRHGRGSADVLVPGMGVSRLSLVNPAAVALTARWLIGLCFLFATLRKLFAPEFMDGSFFHFVLLTGPRFSGFSNLVGGVPADVAGRKHRRAATPDAAR